MGRSRCQAKVEIRLADLEKKLRLQTPTVQAVAELITEVQASARTMVDIAAAMRARSALHSIADKRGQLVSCLGLG